MTSGDIPGGPCDLLLRGVRVATMDPTRAGPYGAVGAGGDGAVAIRAGRIAFVGTESELPGGLAADEERQCDGAWLTPGLVDCHTHLVYGGNRADEFERRLEGVSYEEIARQGGGIRATVRATREATPDELVAQSLPRLDPMLAEGITTVEIKSGYGLDLENERKMLRVIRRLGAMRDVTLRATFLGAHAVPDEYEGRADDYIDHLIDAVLPELAAEGLVDAVDGFCETIGFSPAQIARLFTAARGLGLRVKLHAEQLSNQGGGALVAGFDGLSADHLEWLDDVGIDAMRAAGTVAVLLPGAFYFLRDTRVPPLAALREAGVPVAVATDCNPGSSPMVSPLLALNMAAVLFRMTPAEALAGMTRHGARALGLDDRGTITVDLRADLCLWAIDQPADLAYMMGANPLLQRFVAGR